MTICKGTRKTVPYSTSCSLHQQGWHACAAFGRAVPCGCRCLHKVGRPHRAVLLQALLQVFAGCKLHKTATRLVGVFVLDDVDINNLWQAMGTGPQSWLQLW